MTDNQKKELEKIAESLSPIEKKIIPFLKENGVDEISKKSNLEKTSVLRALQFLSNKKILSLTQEKTKYVDLSINGIVYLKSGLPERRLINTLIKIKKPIEFKNLKEIEKTTKLNKNEIMASIGTLKAKRRIEINNGKISISNNVQELIKKFPEEIFLESLPKETESLDKKELEVLKTLQKRKQIIETKTKSETKFELTNLGKEVLEFLKTYSEKEFIESLTPKMINEEKWRGRIFRRYDIESNVPSIYGGKRHFVNQSIDYARKIWSEMGFEEMTGNLTQPGFWNFDALFTAQDHPAREIQDTFFIKDIKAELPEKEIVNQVKIAHEKGTKGSKGWQYNWSEEEAKKLCLRTHTTCLSAQTLSKLRDSKEKKGKYFAIGKCFRNETIDWSHGFEFNQTEGIVIDENANFRNLLGYLKEFAKKMGYEKIRFRPHYFPYTEPSLEGDVWNEERKEWTEVFAAGIFRPEVTEPLLGKPIPVLAWGPGFDRMVMMLYNIKDLRSLYKNDLDMLRKIKFWSK
jgi:phenylalanyl-tRNA synthetase alpha chain